MVTDLRQVFDDRTMMKKLVVFARENKGTGETIEDFICYYTPPSLWGVIVPYIPKEVAFDGEDLVNYIKHISFLVGCTNFRKVMK